MRREGHQLGLVLRAVISDEELAQSAGQEDQANALDASAPSPCHSVGASHTLAKTTGPGVSFQRGPAPEIRGLHGKL